MNIKELLSNIRETDGWAPLEFVFSYADSTYQEIVDVINELYLNKTIDIITIYEAKLCCLNLQTFREFIDDKLSFAQIIIFL